MESVICHRNHQDKTVHRISYMLFYIASTFLIGILFLHNFSYISKIGFNFVEDSLGPFVFLVSAYIIFHDRKKIKDARITLQPFGIIGIVLSIALYFVGLRAELPQIYHVSSILLLLTSSFYLFGWEVTKLLLFPIIYTLFAIPLGTVKETIGIPLRFFVSTVSANIFTLLGMHATRIGTTIYLESFSFDIAAPCSGINSLFSLLALSAVFAYLMEQNNFKRFVLFISAIPIAVVSNIFRICSIGLVAKGFNKEIALSMYHDYSGYVIFLLSLCLLFLEKKGLDLLKWHQKKHKEKRICSSTANQSIKNQHHAAIKQKIIYIIVLITAIFIVYGTAFTKCVEIRNFDLSVFSHETVFGKWTLTKDMGPTEMETAQLPGSTILRKIYQNNNGDDVQMLIVSNNLSSSIHTPTDCLPGQGWVIDEMRIEKINLHNDGVPINSLVTHFTHKNGIRKELVWYFYAGYRSNYSNHFSAVAHNAIQRAITGKKFYWALVRLSVPITKNNEDKAFSTLQDFLEETYPTIKQTKDSY